MIDFLFRFLQNILNFCTQKAKKSVSLHIFFIPVTVIPITKPKVTEMTL